MAGKKKFSNNWKKAKQRVTQLHSKIADIRKDFLHKSSNDISKNHAVVFVEDLQVQNMRASSKGTKAQPGKRVAQKCGLNRSILDASPSSCVGSWSTRRNGGAAFSCPCHHRTPAASVLSAGTQRRRTARGKRSLFVSGADSQRMQILSAR